MKKLVAVACFTMLGAGAFAQTTQGTMVVSGAVSFSSENFENQSLYGGKQEGNRTAFFISPSIGKFYKDNLEVGISTGFGIGRYTSGDENREIKTKNYNISLGTYIRKYLPITEKLYFTAGAGVGIEYGKTKNYQPSVSPSNDFNTLSYSIGASPGLTYFATEKIGLSLYVGQLFVSRSTSSYKNTDQKSINTDFGANISPSSSSIAIRYFINR